MCTSSIIYILYLPAPGGMRTCSIRLRISSTELFDAASSSCTLKELPRAKALHESHSPQASTWACKLVQLMVLASMRAQVVLPTPRGPQNKNACASWLFFMAFFNVLVICCWPTTVSKVTGRYLRAETIKLSIATKL